MYSTLLYTAILGSESCLAAEFSVEIIDQNGDPVSHAVVVNPVDVVTVGETPISGPPAVMDQVDKRFVPFVLAVKKGRPVVFPNSDNIRHHVYSFSEAKRFEIKLYANKPKAPVTFETEGLVVLGCNIHDSMIGYIFVSQWSDFVVSDGQGIASFSDQAILPEEILVWHPWSSDAANVNKIKINQWPDNGKFRLTLTITKPKKKSRFKRYSR